MACGDGGDGSVVSTDIKPPSDEPLDKPQDTGRKPISVKSLMGLGVLLFAVSTAQTWWADRYDSQLGSRVADLAAPGDIRMVSSENCAICQLARNWLLEHRVPFQECFIERDSECLATHQASGAVGTPLFIIRGQMQMGFNAEALQSTLRRTAQQPTPLQDL